MENVGATDPLKVGEIVKKWNEDFLKSGPVLAIVFEGVNAVERVRALVGNTVPSKAQAGTVRGDFSLDSALAANRRSRTIYNLIHASGYNEEAQFEIDLWFKEDEILSYRRIHEDLYLYCLLCIFLFLIQKNFQTERFITSVIRKIDRNIFTLNWVKKLMKLRSFWIRNHLWDICLPKKWPVKELTPKCLKRYFSPIDLH